MRNSKSRKENKGLSGARSTNRGEVVFVTNGGQCTEFTRIPHAQVNAPPGTPVDSKATMVPVEKT